MWEKWFYWGCLALFGIRAAQWRHRARKGLVLSLLVQKSPQTGMQLKDAGAPGSVYTYLYELEREGLVESEELDESPIELLPRGGIRRRIYRIRRGLGLPLGDPEPVLDGALN